MLFTKRVAQLYKHSTDIQKYVIYIGYPCGVFRLVRNNALYLLYIGNGGPGFLDNIVRKHIAPFDFS